VAGDRWPVAGGLDVTMIMLNRTNAMSDNADIAASDIDFLFEHYDGLISALVDQLPIEPAMLYLWDWSVESNLVLLRALLYELLDLVDPLMPSLAHSIVEWRSAMAEREATYTQLEATTFSRAALVADYQKERERFLGCLAVYDRDSVLNKLDTHKLSHNLALRTWLAYLLPYLHSDDPQGLKVKIQDLDASLLAHMPLAFVQWLGSWDDHEYCCLELEPRAHWWRFREGYAAADTAGA
jgi:hypothetical protein